MPSACDYRPGSRCWHDSTRTCGTGCSGKTGGSCGDAQPHRSRLPAGGLRHRRPDDRDRPARHRTSGQTRARRSLKATAAESRHAERGDYECSSAGRFPSPRRPCMTYRTSSSGDATSGSAAGSEATPSSTALNATALFRTSESRQMRSGLVRTVAIVQEVHQAPSALERTSIGRDQEDSEPDQEQHGDRVEYEGVNAAAGIADDRPNQ